AHDPDGNPLSYLWLDTCGGSFNPANAAATVWTAPPTEPPNACQLSIKVADAVNETTVTAYLVIQVRNQQSGNAQVTAQFNTFPVVVVVKVDEFIVQPGQAPTQGPPPSRRVGISADIAVTASDPDGDPLTFAYSSSCATATFTPPDSSVTRFFVADPQATCSISVSVSDGRGGTTTGVVFLSGAQPPVS